MIDPQFTNRIRVPGSLQIAAELGKIKRRAYARLGTGIDPRSVKVMMSKLDEERRRR